MKPIDKVLDRLDVRGQSGGWHQAICPAHDDSSPSLSVKEGDTGAVLLKCHAKCDKHDVVHSMGLDWPDLFPEDAETDWKPWDGTKVATYDYVDADGAVRYQVERYEMRDPSHPAYGEKQFLQRVPGKKGGPSKHNIKRVPYRLPEVLEAIEDGTPIFFCEGEKVVQAAEGLGFVATCSAGGANTHFDSVYDELESAKVLILPDNDGPGREYARSVAEKLLGRAELVKIVDLPGLDAKEDLVEWIERGGTAEQLKQLAKAAPTFKPSTNGHAPKKGTTFWRVNGKSGEVSIDRAGLLAYLEAEGYGKTYDQDDLDSSLVCVQDQVVERTSAERIKDHVLGYVRAHAGENVVAKLLRGARVYFSESLLEFLPVLDLQFKRDSESAAFFYFENGFVEVTAEGFTLHDYDELDGVIWKDQIVDRDFEPQLGSEDVLNSDWHQFLKNIAGGNDQRLDALASAIGYLLHGWRDPAESKAVVFMDEKDSDVPNGRTGKSVVAKSLKHLVPTERIDARNFSFESRFRFQQVQMDTRTVDFNDASKRFDFDRLFSVITDDWPVERKGQHAFTIPFDKAPKVVISTNYVIEGQGSSFEDRVFQVEFAPHYTADHKPMDDFGRRFFTGWNADQWAAFDNLMMGFVRSYLVNGLVPYEHVNLDVRRLKQQTCPDFAEWVLDFIEYGREYEKDALWRTFKQDYAPDYDDLTKRKMGYWLSNFARIYDLEKIERKRRSDGSRVRYIAFAEKD